MRVERQLGRSETFGPIALPDSRARTRSRCADRPPDEAPIGHDPPFWIRKEQHVAGLDVAVYPAPRVGGRETRANLVDHGSNLICGDYRVPADFEIVDCERHDEPPVLLVGVEDRHDVRVVDSLSRVDLAPHAGYRVRISPKPQALHRNDLSCRLVDGAENVGLSTGAARNWVKPVVIALTPSGGPYFLPPRSRAHRASYASGHEKRLAIPSMVGGGNGPDVVLTIGMSRQDSLQWHERGHPGYGTSAASR